jgi:hypothetical protein
MGMTALAACSSDRHDVQSEEQSKGTLSLALQAMAPLGNVYRLRNAFFLIIDTRTGEFVDTLFSEEGLPEDAELTRLLQSGDYVATLEPGWFMERVAGSGGGSGGSSSTGGGPSMGGSSGKAGSGPIGEAGAFPFDIADKKGPKGPPVEGGAGPFGEGGTGSVGEAGADVGGSVSGGTGGAAGGTDFGGAPPEAGTGGVAGSGGVGGGGGLGVVQAELISSADQFFTIFGQQDTFVSWRFKVGSDVIDFQKGTAHFGFEVEEETACVPPEGVTMPQRVLLETNTAALQGVSLKQALEALATNGGHQADGLRIYNQIYDSFASADLAQVPDAVHCGDETTDGAPSLNGYPIECDRFERVHVNDPGSFFATAFVNRFDLAPANGAHCGQQRMIFASNSFNRAFIIIEAQVPNPAPELGIDGCRPLAQFWLDQNGIADAQQRGERLARAFLTGDPELEAAGFGPFYTAENLTVGSGQIRTNQFDSFPWTLREFKLALDGDSISAIPFPVAESPNGQLWNDQNPLPQGEACRENFLTAAEGLLTDDLSRMSFVVDGACKDAESRNDFSESYSDQMSDGFRALLESRFAGTGLSANDIANRAQFAGSCIGCHSEASGRFLGNGVFAPISADFPQVTEFATRCAGGESGNCFPTSSSLRGTFLPGRMQVMSNLLGFPIVENPCEQGGGGGVGGGGNTGGSGPGGFAGSASAGTSFGGSISMGGGGPIGGPIEEPLPEGSTEPAPVVLTELPSVDEPIEQLEEQDQELRELYGDVTLSGRSAKVTH